MYSYSTKIVGPAFNRIYIFITSVLTGGLPEKCDIDT